MNYPLHRFSQNQHILTSRFQHIFHLPFLHPSLQWISIEIPTEIIWLLEIWSLCGKVYRVCVLSVWNVSMITSVILVTIHKNSKYQVIGKFSLNKIRFIWLNKLSVLFQSSVAISMTPHMYHPCAHVFQGVCGCACVYLL